MRGFNAFSYADVASELKITNAALHYHFAGKSDLGEALIARYASRFCAALRAIDARLADATDRLDAPTQSSTLRFSETKRMCLCGMLAAKYLTLPVPMQKAIVGFFSENEVWLTDVLELGREQEALRFDGSAPEVASPARSSARSRERCSSPDPSATSGVVSRSGEARLLTSLRPPPSPRAVRTSNGLNRATGSQRNAHLVR